MDFASLLSSQISKAAPPSTSSATSIATQKYQKRADVEAERQATYRREQEQAAAERGAKLKRKREEEEEEARRNAVREEKRRRLAEESKARREREEIEQERRRRKRLGLPETPPPTVDQSKLLEGQTNGEALAEDADISEQDLTTRLRTLEQPIFLFGEMHTSRLARYRSLATTSTTKPLIPTPPSSADPSLPIPTILALLPETEIKVPVPAILPSSPSEKLYLLRQLTTYFTLLFREWSLSLSLRAPEVKSSFQGKQAFQAYTQSLTAITPLFRKFEHKDTLLPNGNHPTSSQGLPDSILLPLISIVGAAQERRYVDANDGYLKLSIGKAAWPIGVTMVGIVERMKSSGVGDRHTCHCLTDVIFFWGAIMGLLIETEGTGM